eukprot:TRINITY_DN11580_c0_g1_i3.p1 TRINITY_DN11580_c0_g1~~TRINITY_DN11580_c0_g1_i3.p1  ORF type:complete len:616 (-),score=133.30 TRINITY_DN11580_c0_g1_i3:66-1913(-)
MPFFVQDFIWTEHNYDNMVSRSEELSRWWKDISKLRNIPGIFVESIDDFLKYLQNLDSEIFERSEDLFVDQVFEVVFQRNVVPVLSATEDSEPLPGKNILIFRGFVRWLMGQLAITSKFHFLPESEHVREKIISDILKHGNGENFTHGVILEIRSEFENYLKFLSERNFISVDDERTFSEVYPLFDPFYVSYDREFGEYESLSEVSTRIFSEKTHFGKYLKEAEKVFSRSFSEKEKNFLTSMYRLVENSGGQILNGVFVTEPGVMLLATTTTTSALPPGKLSEISATFLISGVSVETSLELVAHKEATVARLTSSKTSAMNLPLFCVQGTDTLGQRNLVTEILKKYSAYDLTWNPRNSWNFDRNHGILGTELFNMNFPATKCTFLCYTMTLANFHNLFIGRMGPGGNEFQVRHVVEKMARALHKKFPEVIKTPTEYLHMKNSDKVIDFGTGRAVDSVSVGGPLEDGIRLLGATTLTREAKFLFLSLNLNPTVPEYVGLSEFRSRITYLTFPKEPETAETSLNYLSKIINEHGHTSVLGASHVIFSVPGKMRVDPNSAIFTFSKSCGFGQDSILFFSLKELRSLVLAGVTNGDPNSEIFSSLSEQVKKNWSLVLPR